MFFISHHTQSLKNITKYYIYKAGTVGRRGLNAVMSQQYISPCLSTVAATRPTKKTCYDLPTKEVKVQQLGSAN